MTTLPPTLIFLSHLPHHPLTQAGFRYAKIFCETWQPPQHQPQMVEENLPPLKVFLYADAVQLANRFNWQPADQPNPSTDWQLLAQQYGLVLQACVSAALSRGITDAQNSHRHDLTGENLAAGFELVGLGELAMHGHAGFRVIQF